MKMGFNKEQLKGLEPIPNGMYDMLVKEMSLVKTKDGSSQNLRIVLETINFKTPKGDKGRVFDNINEKMGAFVQDFVHGCGMPMEKDPGGNENIPGEFLPPVPPKEGVIGIYKGPLVGRTVKAEIVTTTWQGKQNNKVKQYVCKVDNCAAKFPEISHSTNHVKN